MIKSDYFEKVKIEFVSYAVPNVMPEQFCIDDSITFADENYEDSPLLENVPSSLEVVTNSQSTSTDKQSSYSRQDKKTYRLTLNSRIDGEVFCQFVKYSALKDPDERKTVAELIEYVVSL